MLVLFLAGCAAAPPPAPEVLRSPYRPDVTPLTVLPDGRRASAQYLVERTVVDQTAPLLRAVGEDRVLELGYAVCDALSGGSTLPEVVASVTAGGSYTGQQAGELVGAFVLLCPENLSRIQDP